MPYNAAADSFHTTKLCSRLSSSEVRFFTQIGRFAFLGPPLGDLGATYDDHLRLIGKRVVDFLLVLIEVFFTRCYGLVATSEEIENRQFRSNAVSLIQIQVEGVTPPIIFARLVRPMNALQLCR